MDTSEINPQSLTIIKLKPQRILNKARRVKRTTRAIKIIGKTTPLVQNRLIRGEFGLRLAEIAAHSNANQRKVDWNKQQIQISLSLINNSAMRAIKQLSADQGKTGGAAVKRRMRAIEVFKKSRSDYNFLLHAARGAISSTMKLRRNIQETIDDEIKYLYFRGFEQPYESKAYIEDIKNLTQTLNTDIQYCLAIYHYIVIWFDHFNELVAEYNAALSVQAK